MRKRILMLYTRVPFPIIGGDRIRVFQFGIAFSRKYDADLLCLGKESSYPNMLNKVFRQVIVFKVNPLKLGLHALLGTLRSDMRLPLQVSGYCLREIRRWLTGFAHNYDLLYLHHVRTGEWIDRCKVPAVLDFHDAISMNYKSLSQGASGWWRLFYSWEHPRILEYELSCLRRFPKTFICSAVDREYLIRKFKERFSSCSTPKLSVIPMGVRNELLNRNYNGEEGWIAFFGKMNYYPNEDAVVYFAKEVFPLVKGELKDLEFIVVGAYPTKRVLRLEKIKGVKVTGFVEDPYTYIEKAKVVVAPMRFGAGMQNKILEAMALRKAVVTTSLGARGIEGEDGKHFVVADGSEDMANKILELLSDVEKRKVIGHNARALIEEKYTWNVIGEKLLKEIEEII